MKRVTVKGLKSNSTILIGESFDNVCRYIPQRGVFIITDSNIQRLYGERFPKFPLYVIEPGEASKSIHSATSIYRWLLDEGADRSSFILGIGGGAVCDLTGFIASTFMRGVPSGFVATSLMAQVDAGIGGKNGINLDGYKNIIGTFKQPEFVLCDHNLLKTLPADEYSNGLAEVVKYSLISSDPGFSFIENNISKILNLNEEMLKYLITQSVKVKARIVSADEQEMNLRRILNLGHTWGHAIEKITGMPHGKSVGVGMVFAANLSCRKGLLTEPERDRIIRLLHNLGLPVDSSANHAVVFDTLLKDKKKEGDVIHFVLMQGIGKCIIEPFKVDELKKFILHDSI